MKLKSSSDTTKYQELLLLHSLYMCFLQENFNIEVIYSFSNIIHLYLLEINQTTGFYNC